MPQQPREIEVLVLERLSNGVNRDQPGRLCEVLRVRRTGRKVLKIPFEELIAHVATLLSRK